MNNNKILFVANVAKEHILKFHQPTMCILRDKNWQVDVACGGKEEIPCCDNHYILPIDRSPIRTNWVNGYRQLKRIIDSGDYDIVYCHTSVGATLARLASRDARKRGTKVISFAHGTYFYNNAPWYNWPIYYPLYKILSYWTDVNITITQEDFLFTQKHFSHAKTYLVNGIGIDTTKFEDSFTKEDKCKYRNDLQIPQDSICMIYCAELIKNKNQTFLLDALKIALQERDNLYLILAGIDHTNGQYREYANRIGVIEHVRFLGWRSDVGNLYKMSDICVASSIREGFGLNLVEAILCGLPVVASNNSGHASIIKDGYNGYLVNLKSPEHFAKTMLLLYSDKKLRQEINRNAMKDIDKYKSENVLKELYSIFCNAIEKN